MMYFSGLEKYLALTTLLFFAQPISAKDLLLYGGTGHDEFLGCLTCSEFGTDAICNEFGSYGSEYSSNSIWNEYANFGSPYSSSSPWNEYTSSNSVPVLVDKNGGFYGYFTINEYRSDAVEFADTLKKWFDLSDGDLVFVRKMVCDALSN